MKKITAIWVSFMLVMAGVMLDRIYSPRPAKAASQFATIICDNFKPINTTASVQIIAAGNANMFVYLCSYNLVPAAADNVAIVEGTGATCGTNTVGMVGGATAATGVNLVASENVALGSGVGAISRTAVAGDNVCLLVSAATQLSGVVGWTQQPF